jgi:hypothetical protein
MASIANSALCLVQSMYKHLRIGRGLVFITRDLPGNKHVEKISHQQKTFTNFVDDDGAQKTSKLYCLWSGYTSLTLSDCCDGDDVLTPEVKLSQVLSNIVFSSGATRVTCDHDLLDKLCSHYHIVQVARIHDVSSPGPSPSRLR